MVIPYGQCIESFLDLSDSVCFPQKICGATSPTTPVKKALLIFFLVYILCITARYKDI